jgi:hypothetical protein
MGVKRRRIECSVKAKASLAAVRGDRTTSELASQFGVHPTHIGYWKKRLLEGAGELFSDDRRRHPCMVIHGQNNQKKTPDLLYLFPIMLGAKFDLTGFGWKAVLDSGDTALLFIFRGGCRRCSGG